MSVIHVAAGTTAAEGVIGALDLLGERAEVFAHLVPLSVGPLADIDGSLDERRKFWSLIGVMDEDWELDRKAEREAWARMASPGATIVVWRGLDADGFLLSLRVAAKVRGTGAQLLEIVNTRFDELLGPFYSSIGVQKPVELAAIRRNTAQVLDVEARAARWAEIRDTPGSMFRELEGDVLQHWPEDRNDSRLLQECSKVWTAVPRVIGFAMGHGAHTGDGILFWRLNELVRTGVLQARGDGGFRTTEVRLAER